jgi:hypothetical protein
MKKHYLRLHDENNTIVITTKPKRMHKQIIDRYINRPIDYRHHPSEALGSSHYSSNSTGPARCNGAVISQ